MADDEKTRKLHDTELTQKTRLVRRSGHQDEDTRKIGEPPKTRVIGRPSPSADGAAADQDFEEGLVTGWLVVMKGPGRGKFTAIYDGMNSVGRDDDQTAKLDFGDDSISRSGHAYITYDYVERRFFIQPGGKPNLIRLNNSAVLQPTEMKSGDRILLGKTELGFVAFCNEKFDWQES